MPLVRTLRVAGYAKDAIVDACHRTNDGKNIRLFGVLDQNKTRFSTYVSQRPLSRRAISLGSFTGAVDFVLQLIRLESLGSELQQS